MQYLLPSTFIAFYSRVVATMESAPNTPIILNLSNGVFKITLNRPDALNCFTKELGARLLSALTDANANREVRAVLITGAGRGFCAGQDLAEAIQFAKASPVDLGRVVREIYNPIIAAIRTSEKPYVCAVNGVAAGAGASLALACDVVVASDSASFVQAFAKLGLIPDSGGTFFLPRLVGLGKASALMMLGDKVSATQASEMGMIYKVVPGTELEGESQRIAQTLAALPTRGLGLTKKLLNSSFSNDLTQQLESEEESQRVAGRTQDFQEGIAAFLEKRAAQFKGE